VGGRFAFFKRRRKTHAAVREEAVTRPNHYNELLQQRRAALPWWKRAAFYMGCGSCLAPLVSMSDVGLSKEEIEQVKMMVPFDDNELNMLVNRFLDLDNDKDGTISHEEFRSMPQFAANPFVDRIFRIFDVKPDQKVTFMEFVSAVAVFSDRGAKADKVKFLFQIYDLDDDGVISREDLRGVLKCILPDSTDAADIDMLVVKTFDECDRDKDGVIDGKEFFEVVAATDVETKVRIKL
jgi:Ca2+-binding EF-hand superfamily protein